MPHLHACTRREGFTRQRWGKTPFGPKRPRFAESHRLRSGITAAPRSWRSMTSATTKSCTPQSWELGGEGRRKEEKRGGRQQRAWKDDRGGGRHAPRHRATPRTPCDNKQKTSAIRPAGLLRAGASQPRARGGVTRRSPRSHRPPRRCPPPARTGAAGCGACPPLGQAVSA